MADNWGSRLEVQLDGTTISPITSLTPTFNVPHTVLHSIEADNVGIIRQPFTVTFTMAIPAIATAVADLTELALTGKEFDVAVVDKEGDDWVFKALKFRRCYVTSAAPSNIVVDSVPQANFTVTSLDLGIEA